MQPYENKVRPCENKMRAREFFMPMKNKNDGHKISFSWARDLFLSVLSLRESAIFSSLHEFMVRYFTNTFLGGVFLEFFINIIRYIDYAV